MFSYSNMLKMLTIPFIHSLKHLHLADIYSKQLTTDEQLMMRK